MDAIALKVVVEKHPDGYAAYPLGLNGVVVGQGDTYDEALADVTSAIRFHIETFGAESQVRESRTHRELGEDGYVAHEVDVASQGDVRKIARRGPECTRLLHRRSNPVEILTRTAPSRGQISRMARGNAQREAHVKFVSHGGTIEPRSSRHRVAVGIRSIRRVSTEEFIVGPYVAHSTNGDARSRAATGAGRSG